MPTWAPGVERYWRPVFLSFCVHLPGSRTRRAQDPVLSTCQCWAAARWPATVTGTRICPTPIPVAPPESPLPPASLPVASRSPSVRLPIWPGTCTTRAASPTCWASPSGSRTGTTTTTEGRGGSAGSPPACWRRSPPRWRLLNLPPPPPPWWRSSSHKGSRRRRRWRGSSNQPRGRSAQEAERRRRGMWHHRSHR